MSRIKNYLFSCLAASLLFSTSSIQANCYENYCDPLTLPHKFYVAPEFSHVRRTREGGTKQEGTLYGIRAGYDRIKRYSLYWGLEGHWTQGTLNGHSGFGDGLRSTFTDSHVEGRLGFTLQTERWCRPSFTPYTGIGYFWEKNRYRSPSPAHLEFLTRAPYWILGFLSNMEVLPSLDIGFNAKACFMFNAKFDISRDREFGNHTLCIEDKVNYRLELPLTYRYCPSASSIEFAFVPFYEWRHYGRRISFPVAFLDTKLKVYGVDLQIIYRL